MERLVVWHRAELQGTDEALAATEVASWTRAVSLRLRAAGGAFLGTMGGTTAAAFDLLDLEAAVECVLALLVELDQRGGAFQTMRASFGLAHGELEATLGADEESTVYFGEALSRAQLLAGAAERGQLILDDAALEFAAATFLFAPSVGTQGALTRGHPIDRRIPRRSACRESLASLAEPRCPTGVLRALTPILAAVDAPGVHRFVLRGSSSAGATDELAHALEAKQPAEPQQLDGLFQIGRAHV